MELPDKSPATFEMFKARMKIISDRIDWITMRTENMAWLGIAKSSNADFMKLTELQAQLLTAAEALIEKYSKFDPDVIA